jgi:biopolymer transport protein ExbD
MNKKNILIAIALLLVLAIFVVTIKSISSSISTNTVSEFSSSVSYSDAQQKNRVKDTLKSLALSIKTKDEQNFDTYTDLNAICSSFYDLVAKNLGELGSLVDKPTLNKKCIEETKQYILGGGKTTNSALGGSLETFLKEQDNLIVIQKDNKVIATIKQDSESLSLEFKDKADKLILVGLALQ